MSQPHSLLTLSRVSRLSLKELREILRDRRTIITLVLMPILVYPLIGIGFARLILQESAAGLSMNYRLVILGDQDRASRFQTLLNEGNQFFNAEQALAEERLKSMTEASTTETDPDGIPAIAEPEVRLEMISVPESKIDQARQSLAQGEVDLVIQIGPQDVNQATRVASEAGVPLTSVNLIYQPGYSLSESAYSYVTDRLDAFNDAFFRSVTRQAFGFSREPALVTTELLPPFEAAGNTLATLLPLILILMTVTGAVYPAIDLTAGERERNTLETLIAAPLPRIGLLTAKYVAVLSVAVLTALVNLLAMSITAVSLGLEAGMLGLPPLSAQTILLIFSLVILFAGFFSAVLLGVTSFARSFKEAQSYLIPLMLLSLAPGFLSLMPSLSLTAKLAVVPLVNIVLLARDLLQGSATLLPTVIAVVSTILYAAVALGIASRIFGTDAILYGSEGSWSDLIRPGETTPRPNSTDALAGLALAFPLFILLSSLPARIEGLSIPVRLVLNSSVSIAIFVGLPLLICLARSIRLRTGLGLTWPSILSWPAAILLGLSLWPFGYEIARQTVSEEGLEQLKKLVEPIIGQLQNLPLILKLLTLAIVPATVEELFFRGFLLNGLRTRIPTYLAILGSSLAFALFHVFVRDTLVLERFLVPMVLGSVLGFVFLKTGSVLPGMLLHTLHNGTLITIAHYQSQLESSGFGSEEQANLPIIYLAIAGGIASAGFLLIIFGIKQSPKLK